MRECGSDAEVKEVVADKGYHSAKVVQMLEQNELVRTYVPERKSKHRRRWKGKPDGQREAVNRNRRRTQGERGRKLQRLRSERVERTFAHLCNTGGFLPDLASRYQEGP